MLRYMLREKKIYQAAGKNVKYTAMTIATRQNVRERILVCNQNICRYIVSSYGIQSGLVIALPV